MKHQALYGDSAWLKILAGVSMFRFPTVVVLVFNDGTGSVPLIVFCDFSLDCFSTGRSTDVVSEARSAAVKGEASLQQNHEVRHSQMEAIELMAQGYVLGQHLANVGFLDITVRRSALVEDAMTQLHLQNADLKKPLRVTFLGQDNVREEGLDEGALMFNFPSRQAMRVAPQDDKASSWCVSLRDRLGDSSTTQHRYNVACYSSEWCHLVGQEVQGISTSLKNQDS